MTSATNTTLQLTLGDGMTEVTSTMASNVTYSADERHAILVRYNDEKATLYIPVVVYMMILMIVGTFGNILVCCVYCCKPTKTSSTFFILALAVLDLMTCLIGMPTEITDLRFPYMFSASAACKLLRFTESVTTMASSVILVSVAIDRYGRICKLGKQISAPASKLICVVAMVFGVLFSWPTLFIFGRSTEELEPEIYGIDCSTSDEMHNTHFPSMYYLFLGLLFLGCITLFTIIYCKIGLQIWRQKRAKIGQKCSRDSEISSTKARNFSCSSTKDSQTTDNEAKAETPVDNGSDPLSTDMSSDQANESYSKKKCIAKDRRISSVSSASTKSGTPKKRKIKVTRTTVVLFAVTVAYIISFLPFLILMVIRSVKKDFEDNLTPAQEVGFKFCVKSYFINNAINPVIYSFLNINFRKDAKSMLTRMLAACCCFCRRNNSD